MIRCFKPYTYDGIQVAMIKGAGGIIIARSNVPQLGMTFESVNAIYGRAKNPWDTSRTVGGSSGVIDVDRYHRVKLGS
jgi:Asp-tRNA(Asn)/Glu-tRNA(Gln) amidotransferase A subunit family amidase